MIWEDLAKRQATAEVDKGKHRRAVADVIRVMPECDMFGEWWAQQRTTPEACARAPPPFPHGHRGRRPFERCRRHRQRRRRPDTHLRRPQGIRTSGFCVPTTARLFGRERMVKPSLMQSLLNRPSRSYSSSSSKSSQPPTKEYHSTKAHLLRAAQAAQAEEDHLAQWVRTTHPTTCPSPLLFPGPP